VKENLSFHIRVVQIRLLLTPATMKKQAQKAQQVHIRMRHQNLGTIRIFSKEKSIPPPPPSVAATPGTFLTFL